MTNTEEPAETTGGDSGTPASDWAATLPQRIRVHALAKLLGSTSKKVLGALSELGESARSPQSSVSREVAVRVAEAVGAPAAATGTGAQPTEQGSAAATEKAVAEAPEKAAEPAQRPEQQPAGTSAPQAPQFTPPSPVFLPPEPPPELATAAGTKETPEQDPATEATEAGADETDTASTSESASGDGGDDDAAAKRRRRRGRRGRGRGKGGEDEAGGTSGAGQHDEQAAGSGQAAQAGEAVQSAQSGQAAAGGTEAESADAGDDSRQEDAGSGDGSGADSGEASSRRRRRRRRRKGDDGGSPADTSDKQSGSGDSDSGDDQVRSVRGSTRLEAKRQRRRDGREAGRKRAPVLSESEFLARRESVERTMVVKESASGGNGKGSGKDRTTEIAVLEDDMLVEHFVTSAGSGSIVGNVYLGRVQNVLPSMEAAFVDIGRGRNAVLYAGEVDWDAAGLEGKSRKIEQALNTGDSVLVQVTKDPAGHKGARLTTQVSLPGRFLVYVPGGGAAGISRKLPENERRRLKDILKRVVPDDAGVIIRTASEGISETEIERDVRRLQAQWEVIKEKSQNARGSSGNKGGAPALLYEEPDMLIKVVRDLFTEDFGKLVVQGSVAWETVDAYVQHVAPDLTGRLERYVGNGDAFEDYRIHEQITKALDRKVWLPSGGYLVIDRTEAMTVIDVNTGKFTGSGGNLEETVTRNNLESAEEIVRQLRLRDIGGIIVIDFIDMVLESNRDLVLRRLTECLGRDRTRHQVAEVTSLGLVQMTRKRIGTGLLEAFSHSCEHCKGRGVVVGTESHAHGGPPSDGGKQGKQRGKRKGEDTPRGDAEPTGRQRKSAASAVHAMASASKVAADKSTGGPAADTASSPASSPANSTESTAAHEKADGSAGSGPSAGVDAAPSAETSAPARSETPAGTEEATGTPAREEAAGTGTTTQAEAAQTPGTAAQEESPQPSTSTAAAGSVTGEDDEVAEVPAPAKRSVRRRARRAASRPAGPPVGASTSTTPGQEEG